MSARKVRTAAGPPLDGGAAAWARLCAYWLVSAGTLGLQHSAGLLLVEFLQEFKRGRAETAVVGAAARGVMDCGAFLVGDLVVRVGARATCVLGAMIAGLGLFVSAEASALWQLYLSFSVLVGLGHSLALFAGVIVTNQWFEKRRSIASAIGNTGAGVGPFILAPLWVSMRLQLGWRQILRVLGGCNLVLLIFASIALTPPPPQPQEFSKLSPAEDTADNVGKIAGAHPSPKMDQQASSTTWAVLRNREVRRIALLIGVYGLGTWIPVVHLVAAGLDQGLSSERANDLVLCFAAGSIGLRVPINALADRLGRRKVWMLASMGYALIDFALPFLWTSYPAAMYPYAVLAGGFTGGLNSLMVTLAPEVVSPEQMGQAVSVSTATLGLGTFAGPVIAGAIFDSLGSYRGGWWFAASCLCSGCLLLLVPVEWFGRQPGPGEVASPGPLGCRREAATIVGKA